MDGEALVGLLGDQHRRVHAFRRLLVAGVGALPAVRAGLRAPDPRVRRQCVRLLDRLVDGESLPDLLTMLDDPAAGVRIDTLHALACDRCKAEQCRPAEGDVLAPAIRLLREDPSKYVRAMACEVVGRWVHTSPLAEAALSAARDHDPEASVRKKAGWFAPGGTIHTKTLPRRPRLTGA